MTSSIRTFLALFTAGCVTLLLPLPGCGSDKGGGGPPGFGGGGGTSGDGGGGLAGGGSGGVGNTGAGMCLLNNCHSDAECEGCSYDRTICDVDNTRCIACNASKPCKTGEVCTSFGTCAPKDLTCATDSSGTPTITCAKDADCAACDPLHQICDTAQSKCVACMNSQKDACTGNQTCGTAGKCEDKCPANCKADADCEKCANGGVEAKACHNHVCAECSASKPCPTGMDCQGGKCVKPCGSTGGNGADCKQDAECYGCGNTSSSETWQCKFPINGGDHGTCKHPAAGCTDLVSSGAVLPPPFDKVTNTCSTDDNCKGVSMDVNVGKLIKDLVGSDEINLGLKKIKIQDAILPYEMNACASIELIDDKKCGVCVPCNDDADCKPIELDPLISQLFKGDPLMQIAASFLMDYLFGKGQKHELHQQCQKVAAGYGICAPCANPLSACGTGSTGGTVGSGSCPHDECTVGAAMDPKCNACAALVCATDLFCCLLGWDDLCVKAVDTHCGKHCPGDPACEAHNPCETGAAMKEDCSECTMAACQADATCCDETNGSWDQTCVDLVLTDDNVRPTCGGVCPGPKGSCSHGECTEGTALTDANGSCSECATIVCAKDPYCCNATQGKWDVFCVSEASREPKCPPCPKKQ